MRPRRFAEGTAVGVGRSREQINRLLRQWGAEGIQWTDEFKSSPRATLRFIWRYEDVPLRARLSLLCDRKRLEKHSIDGRSGKVSERMVEKNHKRWAADAHRTLLILIKGILNAVDQGIITPEAVFLPWLEDRNGQTLAEMVTANLNQLPALTAEQLLMETK